MHDKVVVREKRQNIQKKIQNINILKSALLANILSQKRNTQSIIKNRWIK